MSFVVAIPSYKRAHILTKQTLPLCLQSGIDPNQIHVFIVDDPTEECSYIQATKNLKIHLHKGPLGLNNMRNFITDFFPTGQRILSMDDDIRGVVYMDENQSLQNFHGSMFLSWVESAFEALSIGNSRLFGIYPVKNSYFMKDLPYVTEDLRFCVGTVWGCINDKSIRIVTEEKEDFERTILFYTKCGSVLRYNHIAAKTSLYTTGGGMQSRGVNRQESSKVACEYLTATYPSYCRCYRVKKNGIHEVRLLTKIGNPLKYRVEQLQHP